MKKSTSAGFTLIEILVVVAIISILSSIVIIGLGSAQISARDARRRVDMRQIQTAVELFGSINGTYPNLLGGVVFV